MNEQRILRAAKAHGAVKLSPEFIQARNAINKVRVVLQQTGRVTLGQLYQLQQALKTIDLGDKGKLISFIRWANSTYMRYERNYQQAPNLASPLQYRGGSILLSEEDSDKVARLLDTLIQSINAKRDSI